jgi:hypothetical protein
VQVGKSVKSCFGSDKVEGGMILQIRLLTGRSSFFVGVSAFRFGKFVFSLLDSSRSMKIVCLGFGSSFGCSFGDGVKRGISERLELLSLLEELGSSKPRIFCARFCFFIWSKVALVNLFGDEFSFFPFGLRVFVESFPKVFSENLDGEAFGDSVFLFFRTSIFSSSEG